MFFVGYIAAPPTSGSFWAKTDAAESVRATATIAAKTVLPVRIILMYNLRWGIDYILITRADPNRIRAFLTHFDPTNKPPLLYKCRQSGPSQEFGGRACGCPSYPARTVGQGYL